MKTWRLGALVMALVLAVGGTVAAAQADDLPGGALAPVGVLEHPDLESYTFYWANPDWVTIVPSQDGLQVVKYQTTPTPQLRIERYDAGSVALQGSSVVKLDAAFPRWGGMYAAPDGTFYVLTGRDNPSKIDSRTVMTVRRYDATWTLLGTAAITGGASQGMVEGIVVPFDAGPADMVLVGDRLVVHTSREIYHDGHQTNFTFEVDTSTMQATPMDDLGDAPYSSHSFSQKVIAHGSSLVTIDQGDTYPERGLRMTVFADYPEQRVAQGYRIFEYGGEWGDNYTGASVTGIGSGPSGVIVAGSSVRQKPPAGQSWNHEEPRNAYVVSAVPSTGASKTTWLTKFSATGKTRAGEVRVVQVADDRFALLFDVNADGRHRLEYRLVNSAGSVLASATFPGVFYASLMDPVKVGSALYWVSKGTNDNEPQAFLYGLDLTDPATPTLDQRAEREFARSPLPTISGAAKVGTTLTARPGNWGTSGVRFDYRWLAGGAPIAGATSSTYTPTAAQFGRTIAVQVTASKAGYTSLMRESTATAAVARGTLTPGKPVISGKPTVGKKLVVKPGAWRPSGVALTYQWFSGGTKIAGATKTSYTPGARRKGKTLSVKVTGSKAGYTSVTVASAKTAKVS